jgi:hypothetical protein
MQKTTQKMLGAAVGAAATGAAIAGAYYFYGSEKASKHRKDLKSWANKAEREIVREAKRFKSKALTDKNINAIIGTVAKQYETTKDLDAADVREFVAAMKERWSEARKVAKGAQKKVGVRKKKSRTSELMLSGSPATSTLWMMRIAHFFCAIEASMMSFTSANVMPPTSHEGRLKRSEFLSANALSVPRAPAYPAALTRFLTVAFDAPYGYAKVVASYPSVARSDFACSISVFASLVGMVVKSACVTEWLPIS